MAHPPSPLLPVISELPELKHYPKSRNTIIATLPFDPKDTPPDLAEAIIDHTQENWRFFTIAQKLDKLHGSSLGTLGFLPFEVRQRIFWWYQSMYASCATNSWTPHPKKNSTWKYIGKKYPPLPLTARDNNSWGSFRHLDVSRSIYAEFKIFTVSKNYIKINNPIVGGDFFNLYSGLAGKYMRQLLIEITHSSRHNTITDKELWVSFCQQLPTGIKTVHFLVSDPKINSLPS